MTRRLRRAGLRAPLPPGAKLVARPSRWGNPYTVARYGQLGAVVRHSIALHIGLLRVTVDDVVRELAGNDLVCYCPLGQPCHGDVLLAVANGWGAV